MALLIYPAADNGTADKEREINELQNFIAHEPGDYDGGMTSMVLNHVMRETAKHNLCDFADIGLPDVLEKALQEQKESGQDILLCTTQPIDKNNKNRDLSQLITTLNTIKKNKDYKQIMLPIGTSGYGVAHAMTLAIEGKNAYIFEQFGGIESYKEVKEDIAGALIGAGYTVKMNPKPLTNGNRLDCASVSTHIINEALTADSVESLLAQTLNKSGIFSAADIDGQHKIDKQYARMALKDINNGHRDDRNNSDDIILLQKLISKAGALNLEERMALIENFWNSDNKNKFVSEYKTPENKTLSVDEKLPEADPDQKWKDEVRKAVKESNIELSHDFQEYQNPDHPNHLFFKDGNNDLAFASKQKAYVGGEQKAFDELCATALKLGKETIAFGKFEQHPEYRAMLYLACLKHGLKMTNAPEMEELRQYPQFDEINKIITERELPQKRAELKNKMAQTRQAFNETQEICNNDPEYQALKNDLDNAKKSGDKEAIAAAKEALNGNENAKKLQENRTAYENTLKEAAKFYIKNGSGHPNDKSTPEERQAKLDKHMEQYSPKEFFTKDKENGPTKQEKEQISKYQFAHRVLQNRGNGK